MIRRRSAGPLISKFLKRELARNRSKVSSIMSASPVLAMISMDGGQSLLQCDREANTPCEAGPLILVRIGSTAVLPTNRISGYSLNDEW